MKRALMGICLAVVGCGSSDKAAVDGGVSGDSGVKPIDGGAGMFKLTSTAFADGAAIPVANTCSGANTSPVLAWTGAPSEVKSFALTLIDPDASNFKHWVIYDIPATATGLPAHVENVYAPGNVVGAHQAESDHAPTIGYYGPCPPALHHYHFTVYALDVATLPGGTVSTTAAEAIAAISTHMLAHAELTGTFMKPN